MPVTTSNAQSLNPLIAVSNEPRSDLKLRFAWGGGVPEIWKGKIAIKDGSFSDHRVLAITSDAPSTVVKRGQELVINHRIATSYGGVDAAIKMDGDVSVELLLETESGESFRRSWRLQELSAGINEEIDDQLNRLSITRTPGDRIRVDVNRPHLVFQPGERWQFETNVQRSDFEDQTVRASFAWQRDGKKVPVVGAPPAFKTDENGTSKAQTVELRVPESEGVHNLWIELETSLPKSAFSQFRRTKKIARQIQIVVVSDSESDAGSSTDWQVYQTLTPEQLRGSRNPWPVPRFTGSKEAIRKGEFKVVEVGEVSTDSALEFAPGASLTIPFEHAKQHTAGPVRVSIRYRTVPGTRLAVNYLSATEQILHGMDSGIGVPLSLAGSNSKEEWLTHTFHLWPEEKPGYLYIANNDLEKRAQIGEIKYESGPNRLKSPVANSLTSSGRQRLAFLESPDFSGLFQAQRKVDPQTGQALDDWKTFHDSIDRLTQHLKANSYDGAFVTVAADGSAIFPSFGLAPGPRFDSGVFSSSGCDPIQKDVVELMMRMFDREGLKLIPVMTLNSSIARLESVRESNPMSFDLVDSEGQIAGFDRSTLPIYNPLDRSLQGVCTQTVARFAERYQNHSSFSGLALTCGPDCCTLLPGIRHGIDNVSIQRFANAVNVDAASLEIESLLSDNPENSLHDSWLLWRSSQMTQWYADMAKSLQQSPHFPRPLYLLPVDIYQKPEFVAAMSPSIHRSGDFASAMREIGLDQIGTARPAGVMLLSPRQIAPGYSLTRKRTELNIEQSRVADQFFAENASGTLFAHRGSWQRLKPGAPGIEEVTRKQLLVPSGDANRRRYIEAIRKYDCRLFVDSGHSLPFGGDQEIQSIIRILRELPEQKFEDIGDSGIGPVCMRQLTVDGKHYFYAVNDSPWPVEILVLLGEESPKVLQASATGSGKTSALTTTDGNKVLLEQENGRTLIRVFLEPWSIYGAAANVTTSFNPYRIENFTVSLPDKIDSQLRKRLYQLKSKLAKAKDSKPLPQLLNGSFESFADPDQSGWEFGNHDEAVFDLDSNEYREGRVSLSMKTSGKPVWIRSNPINVPETGRLSISAWMRTDDPGSNTAPRISVEGISDGANLYRFEVIGVGNDQANRLDNAWKRYVVHFDDLPHDVTNLRIGIDLMNKGQVSIDQIEVFDRWFDENDSVAMTQLLASAGSLLQNEQSIDGSRRILESYWIRFLDQHAGKTASPDRLASKEKTRPFELPFSSFEMPSFELPNLNAKKPRRVPLLQRFQRRE